MASQPADAYEASRIALASYFVLTEFKGVGRYKFLAAADTAEEILELFAKLQAEKPNRRLLTYAVIRHGDKFENININPPAGSGA